MSLKTLPSRERKLNDGKKSGARHFFSKVVSDFHRQVSHLFRYRLDFNLMQSCWFLTFITKFLNLISLTFFLEYLMNFSMKLDVYQLTYLIMFPAIQLVELISWYLQRFVSLLILACGYRWQFGDFSNTSEFDWGRSIKLGQFYRMDQFGELIRLTSLIRWIVGSDW